jgi:hypothetical protein
VVTDEEFRRILIKELECIQLLYAIYDSNFYKNYTLILENDHFPSVRDSTVGITTGYGLGRGVGVRAPVGPRISSTSLKPALDPTHTLIQ